jgi:hypothetical protein
VKKCIDCGVWFCFFHSCRICGKPLCGICVDWPSPHLHSPGKGMCKACREIPIEIKFPLGTRAVQEKVVTDGIEVMPPSLYVSVLTLEMLLHIHSQLAGIDALLEGISSNSNDMWNREFNK